MASKQVVGGLSWVDGPGVPWGVDHKEPGKGLSIEEDDGAPLPGLWKVLDGRDVNGDGWGGPRVYTGSLSECSAFVAGFKLGVKS